jgi:hypothetical protein
MRWRCQYYNEAGARCSAPAFYRFLFHSDHPFDYTDRCLHHAPSFWKGKQLLEQEKPKCQNRQSESGS